MPTPYGSRGGMAFSADELRVLRRALAIALQPRTEPIGMHEMHEQREMRETREKQKCLRLAQAVDEAARESGRLRAFLRADLARYRAALPGTAPGYLARLQDALAAGHRPGAEDLAALRALCAAPAGPAETVRRYALLRRCEREHRVAAAVPHSRATGAAESPKPGAKPAPKPGAAPAPERPKAPPAPPGAPRPDRPIPTPGEVFPPRRKPAPPPESRVPQRPRVAHA
ncbi:hypothetical protein [Streptomyces luteireticuli]|uniref:hypothetical protein n=1 Tax=Streptomyces luteireticuli TaxID=173858 RepID=UPI00355654F2